jgi:hypothetical protein
MAAGLGSDSFRNRTVERRKIIMALILLGFAAIGLFAILCKIVIALGHVICWLLKYIVLPLGFIWCICYIKAHGL